MSRKTQRERNEALKQSILDTALQIGMEEGFEALSIRKIINRMQYSTSIIYYHFQNKQEIIDAIVESETGRLGEMIRSHISGTGDVFATMERVFRMITLLAVREPEKYNLIVLRKYSSRKAAKPPWVDYLCGELAGAMERGEVKAMDPYQAAFSIWSSFLGFHLILSLQEDMTERRAEEMFETQLKILLEGIRI